MSSSCSELVFRSARAEDAESIRLLYLELTNDQSVQVLPERINLIEKDQSNFLFVVESDSKVMGSCLITFCLDPMYGQQDYAVLENIVVGADCQGKGVGKYLMGKVEAFCFSKDCTKLMFLSNAKREDAHKFFYSAGFRGDIKKGFVKYRSDVLRSADSRCFFE
ncbi:MAG: GNAT family N-acetyltransferase [Kangiellaceae bacterium]|nr:GNAT family N-acetyltransferase [Kangiellaceae bacterium]